ncbi:hypothetical protein AAC03nite_16200 [Alicyclobacillus acidoterrestris]|uniref:hypothetical protein n=1 Tax=Alicyclobacillus suci TaxID=2816080 RepID=UPI0011917621|nr:hypothetical protein [Alicyclobacillus suci]GEO25835.1 hypothetical protein AAC03nite_16200 [Alicyclobacillus acidoterrestris]
MYRKPSLLISVLAIIAAVIVLSVLFVFLLKLAVLVLIFAAAYYLYARGARVLNRDPRRKRGPWWFR